MSTIETTDTYEPLEEGLDTITLTRRLTALEIVLSVDRLDASSIGFQEPLPDSEVKELSLEQLRARRPTQRGFGRGGMMRRGGFRRQNFRGRGRMQGGFYNGY